MRLIAILATIIVISAAVTNGETITVSAAISLKESLQEIATKYETSTHDHVVFNFDASGKLAAQIRQGALVDAFISADQQQMDQLDKARAITPASRRVVVNNTLVLIVPAEDKNSPRDFADLAKDHGKKIAIGEPKTVPAGRYAEQTLASLKLDKAVASRLVYGESVRQVLTYVEQDEVCGGIVYRTDARQAGEKVKVVATADEASHDRIEYPAAVITSSAHADAAKKFLDYLATDPAKKIFIDKGFTVPTPKSPATRPTPAADVK
jgi:molybdate transport system substrate-binding protein